MIFKSIHWKKIFLVGNFFGQKMLDDFFGQSSLFFERFFSFISNYFFQIVFRIKNNFGRNLVGKIFLFDEFARKIFQIYFITYIYYYFQIGYVKKYIFWSEIFWAKTFGRFFLFNHFRFMKAFLALVTKNSS